MFDMLMEDLSQPTIGKQSQNQFDMGLESDEDESSQPRNMHDLRAAGSKKRIVAELEHLVDGISGQGLSSLSAQRFDLIELNKKIMDPKILNLLLDHGLERRLLTAFAGPTDTIFQFLVALCLTLIINESSNLAVLRMIHRSGCLDRLFGLFSSYSDIGKVVKDRKYNMSKIAQKSVIDLKEIFLQSGIFSAAKPATLSPRFAGIIALEKLIRKIRELVAARLY